ncbi:MAG: NAD-dependent epimerase/dehydratase family protein [Candidatus Solibacter sp.]
MRVFVLGATGHIGQAIVRHWLVQGHAVTAATRQHAPEALRGLPVAVAPIDGDLRNLTELLSCHDLLLDAAAPRPMGSCPPGSTEWRCIVTAAVERMDRVLDAARVHNLPLGFISSFTTLARPQSPAAAREAAWRRATYPYFEAKQAMEQRVLDAARSGMPVAILNPAACLGPWNYRPADSSIVPMVMSSRVPFVMNLTSSLIDVRDVAAAMELALAHQCFGRPVGLAGHNLTHAELAARIAAAAGMPSPVTLGVDPMVASATSWWVERTSSLIGRRIPDEWLVVPIIGDNLAMTPSAEQLALGVRIRPLEETLCDSVAFHRART